MRLTMRTNLAMRILMHCAVRTPEKIRSADVARVCNASVHHVAQVVHRLETKGFLKTTRGRGGGMTLARPATGISVGEVFREFESAVPFTECFNAETNTCPLSVACHLRGLLCNVLEGFYQELDKVTLAELVDGNTSLEALFSPPVAPTQGTSAETGPLI